MKKLYRKGSVHPSPSPSPSPSPTTSDHFLSLSFLPAAILTLSAALSDDDKQLLAYLLSCSSSIDFHPSNKSSNSSSYKKHNNNNNNNKTHQTCFTCYCFTCYTSYWSRWDSSPNRQLIHEIIDAFEDHLLTQRKNKLAANNNNNNNNRRYKKKNNAAVVNKSLDDYSLNLKHTTDVNALNNTTATTKNNDNKFDGSVRDSIESCRVDPVEEGQTEEKQGSVRKMVSFLWETVWG